MKKILTLLLLLPLFSWATIYYVSPTGSDATGTGTISSPYFTLKKAWQYVQAGDTIYVRGGTYYYTYSQKLENKSGSSGSMIRVLPYQNEKPVFDFSTAARTTQTMGISLYYANYIHIKGVRITNIQQVNNNWHYGLVINNNSSNCIIENCEFDHIGGDGLSIFGNCNNNLILNCDSHHNEDPLSTPPYDGSNGFALSGQTASENNVFKGCRAWFNSDDGWDFYGSSVYIELDSCWAFLNGYSWIDLSATGNGIGFKLGPNTNGILLTVKRKLTNCLSFDNRLAGFDANFDDNGLNHFPSTLYNCTAFRNGWVGFWFGKFADVHTFKNNLVYRNGTYNVVINSASVSKNNSWDGGVTVTDGDFLKIDTAGVTGPRQADGSLPILNFLRLKSGSDLIDAGIDVGLPYTGSAPDMGCFEFTQPYYRSYMFRYGDNYVKKSNRIIKIKVLQ